MRRFLMQEMSTALEYAEGGGQALHVHTLTGRHRLFSKYHEIAHLFDRDEERLIMTAKRLGVQVIKVERRGEREQHIDLCGMPFIKALGECTRDGQWDQAMRDIQEKLL